ncbi:MAG: NAD(P)-dependent oxidoreductase [Deltaproteobacteria bacterium]|nr:MAG: NAD(P)-dependent oxidoreductase [Deltaproteobacteria bacterium]
MMLVTGGAGYLGSHLAKELLRRGRKVRIFDVQSTKYIPEGAEFIQGDMRDSEAVRNAVEGIDTVFHLAFVQSLSKLPERERWDININGTENFLKASVEKGVKRFVHTSTIEIYGTHPPYPCPEDSPTDNPVGWYGRHKVETEKILWRYHREQGLDATAVRMPTVCGPGFYNHRPLLMLMDRVIDGKTVAVIEDGGTKGDFVYYQDVIQGYLLAAEKKEAAGEAFNLSCDESSTHLEIIQALRRAVGSRSRIVKIPSSLIKPFLYFLTAIKVTDLPSYQFDYLIYHQVFSVEKAKRLLGYEPTKTAAEAVVELVKGYLQDREFVKRRSRSY